MELNNEHNMSGQTAILFAIMIVGVLAFVGLAVDGGNIFKERRVMQNSADSASLSGVHYLVSSNAPSETRLQEIVNSVAEGNGTADTDGTPGNATNGNVRVFYTDARGNRMVTQPCYIVPCGSIPSTARGLEVEVGGQVSTYFLGVIDLDILDVGANAVAVASGGNSAANLGDNVLVAFGSCPNTAKPLDLSASNVDFIGGVYSSTWFENRGDSNHYHGQTYYGKGYGFIDTAAKPGVYEPDPPGMPQPVDTSPGVDPLAGLFTVADFNCSTGAIGSDPSLTCYDLTVFAPAYGNAITTQLLRQQSPDGTTPFLNTTTGKLRPGIYYGGSYPFVIGFKQMVGTVTFVTSSTIKITENDVQLTGYMPDNTVIPGLLFFSAHKPTAPNNECTNHEDLIKTNDGPINTTGNSGTVQPGVYHADDKPGCVDLDQPSNCYVLGSLQYIGLIYAPYGRVATSGDGASYVGAIIAPSIRVNGFRTRSNGKKGAPDKVGALFVRDPNLFPDTMQTISLHK